MLRITLIFQDAEAVTLRLDGKLIGTCVSTLKKECLNYKDKKNKTVILDFSGLSFIDRDGVTMLESINDEKLQIVNCPIFIEKLLENLISVMKGDIK
ncbi:MAG: STAS domain-containing protein [Deltaproteobacteria bacterium]